MQISGAGQNVVSDSSRLKTVGKGIVLAGKAVAGGVAGMFIDGVGIPAVWTKEIGKSIGRDLLNLVTIKDVPKSLAKLAADTVEFPLVFAGFAVFGTMAGFLLGSSVTDEDGLKEGIDVCVDRLKYQNKILKDINDKRGFFVGNIGLV